jgi:hypothetical protein
MHHANQIPTTRCLTPMSYDKTAEAYLHTDGVGDLEAVVGGPAAVALRRLADPAVLVADVEHAVVGGGCRSSYYEHCKTQG